VAAKIREMRSADENIKESLTLTGHKVRFVNSPRSRFDKTKSVNQVFVELEPAANNKEIHENKTLCRQRVQIELPYKKDDVVQCHRCQAFGQLKIIGKSYPTASDVAYNTVWRPA